MKKKFKGSWILFFLFAVPLVATALKDKVDASAEQGDTVTFSYNATTIHQEVAVDTSGKTELTATVRAAETGYGTDTVLVGIALYGEGGGGIYFHDTGWVSLSSGGFTNISLSLNAQSVGSGWADVRTARLTVGGDDGEFWGGNYGPSIESASLKLDGTELLSNTQFSSGSQNWTSSVGWQTCHATQGDKPCSSVESRLNNSSYTVGTDMVWGEANEGWNLTLTAPGGGIFSQVMFASYGTPSGTNGQYTQGSCHATNSILKVSQQFIGKSTATIGASNGLFDDPCGGTYKKLYIVLKYIGGVPNIPTTTTTTLPTCGPYENINVTGKSNGAVWGSGPYTDDSDMDVAAVHAGLVSVGESATLVPTNIAYHLSYPGSTANGITTADWLSGWCGFDLSLFVPPTTTTTTTTTLPATTTTTTTTTIPETTTTTEPEPEPETTTTTIEPVPTQTTVEETTTTTTEPELQPEVTTTTEPEPEPEPEITTTTEVQPEEEIPTETIPEQEIPAEDPQPEPQPETPTEEVVEVTAENLSEVLDGEVTPEVVDAVVDAIASGDIEITAEAAEQLVDVLTSGEATEEQIVAVVSALIESGEVSSEIATKLATSPEVLQAISGDEAEEIFSSIETSDLTEEAKSEITEAVQNAPEEVKNAFEGEINIYAEGFDDYVPVGSSIDVGTRRTLLAATTALASATAAMAANGGPRPSSGGSGPGSNGPSSGGSGDGPTGGNNNAARKEEEEGSEDEGEDPEIEGPDGDEEEGNFTRNSIFKYTEGTMEKRFSPLGFIKKFAKETAALAFTISGTVIVFATLSGDTRRITVIATSIAFAVHYLNAMLQNDE